MIGVMGLSGFRSLLTQYHRILGFLIVLTILMGLLTLVILSLIHI